MKSTCLPAALLLILASASAPLREAPSPEDRFPLLRMLPQGIYLVGAERDNPDRAFISRYWQRVLAALKKSGFEKDLVDLLGLVGGLVEERGAGSLAPVRKRILALAGKVDWAGLTAREAVTAAKPFARVVLETAPPYLQRALHLDHPSIAVMNMVMLSRCSREGAAQYYRGLSALLGGMVAEINRLTGKDSLAMKESNRSGARISMVDLMGGDGKEEALVLAVGVREDIIAIGVGEQLFEEVLARMDGSAAGPSLAEDPRFRAAFSQLPAPEDGFSFLDVPALLGPLERTAESLIEKADWPPDAALVKPLPPPVEKLRQRALTALQQEGLHKALPYLREADKLAPGQPMILYELAHLHARVGNRHAALTWLDRAVTAGLYAPWKISEEKRFKPLWEDPDFASLLQKAVDLALRHKPPDRCLRFTDRIEVLRQRHRVHQAYKKGEFRKSLELCRQAHAMAPGDGFVLYTLASIHARLGQMEECLEHLEKAVAAGLYCPALLSQSKLLAPLRGDRRFQAALATARTRAGDLAVQEAARCKADRMAVLRHLSQAFGLFDWSATVKTTEGHRVTEVTLTRLAADARQRSAHAILQGDRQRQDFDRYLPAETHSFSLSCGIDWSALYRFIIETVRRTGREGELLLSRWRRFQEQSGFDVEKDVTGWIQGDMISLTLADQAGSVTMIRVKDEKKAREMVDRVLDLLPQGVRRLIAENPLLVGLAMLGFRRSPVKDKHLEGFQNLHFTMSPRPVVWGVRDGHLIIGTTARAIGLVLATARGEHPGIRTNPRVVREALLPSGPFRSVSYADKSEWGKELEQTLTLSAMMTGMLGSFFPEPRAKPVLKKISSMMGKLVPVVREVDFYRSTAFLTTCVDSLTWKTTKVTLFRPPDKEPPRDE